MADVLIKEWDIGAMRRPDTDAPSAKRTPGANFPWDSLNFDKDNAESVFMFGTMPEADLYAAGQDIKFEVSWISDPASVNAVVWAVYILGRATSEAWDVAFPDNGSVVSPRVAGDALHVGVITIAGPALTPGDDIVARLRREAGEGDDDYGADADLVRVRMYAA